MEEAQSILIVDDDPQIRKLVSVNLEARGYSVKEAANGADALSSFKQEPFFSFFETVFIIT